MKQGIRLVQGNFKRLTLKVLGVIHVASLEVVTEDTRTEATQKQHTAMLGDNTDISILSKENHSIDICLGAIHTEEAKRRGPRSAGFLFSTIPRDAV
ncbi:hypothetical protein H9L39_00579 [Fusarium oxysporum f. sp. albedinis]|nr:hypothetical protein H9L39_00579 [Fusarium oxysporum f. sp. albedinis]